jgi:hypothetical protein
MINKAITSILLLLLAATLPAQDFSFSITPDGQGKFTLDVVTIQSAVRSTIERAAGLDTTQVQNVQYARIESAYNAIARAQVEADRQQQRIRTLRQSLESVGLEQYNQAQVARFDSFFVATWRFQNTAGRNLQTVGQYRAGNTTVLRDPANGNTPVASITPFSSNYIRLDIVEAYRDNGVATVFMYTENGRVFVGSVGNVRYRIVRE